MSFNSKIKIAAQSSSGNLDGDAAGTLTGGSTVQMRNVEVGTLSALVTVDAETNTITLGAVWEVSNDASTWYVCTPVNNAATVVLATGTGGADAAVTRVIPANDAVYGYRYARCSIQNLVAQGTTNDTYSISYNYRMPDFVG